MRWQLGILLLVLAASSALATSSFENMDYFARAGEASCYANGQLVVPFTQFKGVVPLPGFIQSVAIMIDEDTYTGINGGYYDKSYKPAITLGSGETGLFVADEYSFQNAGNYTIVLSGVSYAIIALYENVKLLHYPVSCPGYSHGCSSVNLSVYNCTYDKDFVYVDFRGVGHTQSQVNLTRDLEVRLMQRQPEGTLMARKEFYTLGADDYRLVIDAENLSAMPVSVAMKITGCIQGMHHTEDSQACYRRRDRNLTLLGTDDQLLQCGTGQQPQQFCTLTVAHDEQKVSMETATLRAWRFARRLVTFALRIPRI